VTFKFKGSKLIHGMFRAQTVGPNRGCMNCLGAIDAGEIQMDRDGKFDDPDYIKGLEKIGLEQSRQNIMPFSIGLASLETIQFVELLSNLARKGDLGQQAYDYYTAELIPEYKQCASECEYPLKVGRGDSKPPFLSTDISKARQSKSVHLRGRR
jgi:molybdopterin-synthase adenylyltransferase